MPHVRAHNGQQGPAHPLSVLRIPCEHAILEFPAPSVMCTHRDGRDGKDPPWLAGQRLTPASLSVSHFLLARIEVLIRNCRLPLLLSARER